MEIVSQVIQPKACVFSPMVYEDQEKKRENSPICLTNRRFFSSAPTAIDQNLPTVLLEPLQSLTDYVSVCNKRENFPHNLLFGYGIRGEPGSAVRGVKKESIFLYIYITMIHRGWLTASPTFENFIPHLDMQYLLRARRREIPDSAD